MKYRMVIEVTDEGRLKLEGPMSEPLVLYGLLGLAHNAIAEMMRANVGKVQVVKPGQVPDLKIES